MTVDRRARLWGLVVELANGTPVAVEHVCGVAVSVADVDGASVAVALSAAPRETLFASDDIASDLEELALTLGEGPCVDAFTGGPALAADLTITDSTTRWPAFAPAAVAAGAKAVFSLPLQVGGIRLGSMDLYRGRPGALDRDQLADALILADTTCALLLDGHQARSDGSGDNASVRDGSSRDGSGGDGSGGGGARIEGRWPERAGPHHPEVHQATGMITVQLGVTAAVALIRLRAYAFANDRHLRDVAADVVARKLRFNPGEAGEDG